MALDSGTRLGSYTVVSPLGAGGMGEVYRAHDSKLGRDVALKVLPPDAVGDAERVRRFAREARAVAALNHPNIITVFDVNDAEATPFIATELIDGETLRDRLSRGPLALGDAVSIALQIAEGLAHAHDARIVHRDLKPQNVMLKPDGLVKIVDFGLGKVLDPASTFSTRTNRSTDTTLTGTPTARGTIVGTAGYMSPEQVTGKPVDGRSDQFAFGALLYEMLTGVRAFSADSTIETISSVLSSEPRPVQALAPSTPPALVAIVERCLAKSPAERYANTHDLAHDLQAIRHDLIGSRRRSTRIVPPVTRRTVYVVGAVLAVAVVAAIASVLYLRTPARGSQQIAVLPFTNIQRDPANDAFADGIVELLTTNLTQLERNSDTLRVVPASDVRRYGVASAKEARQTFGVGLAVSGSIQRTADTIRLTLNLIDTTTGEQTRARVIDAKADNPLVLQDRAFEVLAAMLGTNAGATTASAATPGGRTLVPGAYDYYVQGRGYLARYERAENVDNAVGLFRRAIAADPSFAQAQASLGEALWRKYELTKDTALIADARAACAKALAITDQASGVHLTLSMIARGTGEYETAALEAKRAIDLDPSASDGRRELARAYEALGQFDQAEATYKEAIARRPGDWSGYNELGRFYFVRKDYASAERMFRRVIDLTPDNARAYSNLGGMLFSLGRYADAKAMYERSVALQPTASALSNLGTLLFRQERFNEAAAAFRQATTLTPGNYTLWGNLASAIDRGGDEEGSKPVFAKAAQLAEQARALNPRQPGLNSDLAGYYAASGQVELAHRAADEALRIDGRTPATLAAMAVTYNTLKERDRAASYLLDALSAGYPATEVLKGTAWKELLGDPRVSERLRAAGIANSETRQPQR